MNEIKGFFDPSTPDGPIMTRLLTKPLPKEIEGLGGKYVLDFEGNFTASYSWEPDEFHEWDDGVKGGEG